MLNHCQNKRGFGVMTIINLECFWLSHDSHVLLLKLFSQDIWKRLWRFLDADGDGVVTAEELRILDTDGDAKLSKAELRSAIANFLGLSAVEGQDTFLDHVLDAGGDLNLNGRLSLAEINKQN